MPLQSIIKRSGESVQYDRNKIYNAIAGANKDATSVQNMLSAEQLQTIVLSVENELQLLNSIGVEQIQDIVEKKLMEYGFYDVAKQYIVYRENHAQRRKVRKDLLSTYHDIFFVESGKVDSKRENANINGNAPMGMMLKVGTETCKYYIDNYVLPKEFSEANRENWIHIHDKDFSLITLNCCQIDLLKLFKRGFSTGHGYIRPPQSIRACAALACVAVQSNQNDQFGGQSINCFDYAMAYGIRKSFIKALANQSYIWCKHKSMDLNYYYDIDLSEYSYDYFKDTYSNMDIQPYYLEVNNRKYCDNQFISVLHKIHFAFLGIVDLNDFSAKCIYKLACEEVEKETRQAMEALIHNFNTLHSRAGAQTPFSSINFGMDISPEGRLATKEVLNAIAAGLGNGETPIFPISVFLLKDGINYNPCDKNYDLFVKACEVSAKRLFPNFVNLDSSFNLPYYKKDNYNSYVVAMGCRTRVIGNVNGPEECGGRGNFAFVTLNLPKMAIEAKGDLNKFFELYDKYIQIAHDYILFRLSIIEQKHVYNFPFLMGQGVWMDSDKLKPSDTIKDVLKHASYSIGFCGLAECLVSLTGKHHGESEESQKLGLEIIKHLRDKTDEYTKQEKRNWSTFATPAESTAGSFQRSNQKYYGIIKGVTDREYMTNSSHVPVYYPINAFEKIKIEAPYHALCNAGHIAYIEMDGDPTKNVKVFEKLIRAMHDSDMGYFSINHPVDRDPVCGYTGIINNECPHCHRKETSEKEFVINGMRL